MNGGRFLGHSIGMCMDEIPVIAGGVKDRVEENMVFAVEPKSPCRAWGWWGRKTPTGSDRRDRYA